jgi:prepilin-type N-terminal cleavage/methylation domain-containing protein
MSSPRKAFTLLELLVVLSLLALLGVLLLPALASTQTNSQKTTCLNNLKQIGLAFRTWEGGHGGKYPMAVAAASGGASDFLSHNNGSASPNGATASLCPGMAFLVMSNQLSSAKVLFCPTDNFHTLNNGYATNFSYQDLLGVQAPVGGGRPSTQVGENAIAGSKISYFVNGDATEANPQDILTGDDNIGNGGLSSTAPGAFHFGGSAVSISCPLAVNGVTSLGITSAAYGPAAYWSWTANDFHRQSGNLGMADGSCQSTTITGLHYYLGHSTNAAPAEAINFMP